MEKNPLDQQEQIRNIEHKKNKQAGNPSFPTVLLRPFTQKARFYELEGEQQMTTVFLGLLFITSGLAATAVIAHSLYNSVLAARALYQELAFIEAIDSFAAQQATPTEKVQSTSTDYRTADWASPAADTTRHQQHSATAAGPVIYRPIIFRKEQPPHCSAAA
ncbi:hypothetical protein GRI39_00975 [Altererythrobacter indicus]|uniref:Uncharacterized protein n=1 Tax=Altericroceibacterium indicum TaxID=374177 RepID=A0A845A5L1_9SPHN|nr:hypothetical protein [Altericroceibacterium indicum]MXP24619.1 hypothetical protein [Altericroceibacterium indicum]